jgi:cytochrome P450
MISDDEYSPEAIADPYTFYGRMRDAEPVHWNRMHQLWTVTSYEHVAWVTRNHELFSNNFPKYDQANRHAALAPEDEHLCQHYRDFSARQLIRADRPEHFDMRMVFQKHFTPRRVEQYRPMVKEAIGQLLDEVRPGCSVDVMHDLAEPLPVMVITSLLGIPYQQRPFIRELTPKLIPNAGDDPYRMRAFDWAVAELTQYVEPLIEARLAEPSGDLMSAVAEGEWAGIFTRADSIANASLLIVAGHETTINLIANSVLDFIQNPEQWELLRSEPAGLAFGATEESLRYEAPVKVFDRIALQDVELAGQQIHAGDRVRYVMSSANRDPARFDQPDRMDITRHPNPHLTFGNGIHHCLGAGLARVEGEELLRGLAERFGWMRLDVERPTYHHDHIFRSLAALPVTFEAA